MERKISFWVTIILWGVSFVLALVWIVSGGDSLGLAKKRPVAAKRIAVVEIFGPITYEGDSGDIVRIRSGGVLSWVEGLEMAANDPLTSAVVLRINSPGGTVGATQELYAAIRRLREKGKVVVASLGDMATSGGYYIATACDAIVSLPGTLTGSIGVIMQGFQYGELLRKIGVRANVIKSGKNKDIFAGYREMTPEEEEILFSVVSNTYEQFLAAVMEGRRLSRQEVKSLADGRIFTGSQAFQAQLVDKLGTFEDAVMVARELAKLPPTTPLYYPIDETFDWRKFLRRLSVFFRSGGSTGFYTPYSTKIWYYGMFE